MRIQVPQWVCDACRLWGRQKRRIWSGTGEWYYTTLGEKRRHIDGYAQSFLGRVQDERYAAGATEIRQYWPEVYWGEAWDVQRAIAGMPERAFVAIHLHYVFDPDFGLVARRKAYLVGIDVRRYWEQIAAGETWIWGRLISDENGQKAVRLDNSLTLKAKTLPFVAKKRKNHPENSSVVEVSLATLNRPVLSLKH